MAREEPKLIIQVPRGGAVDRQLDADPPQSVSDGEVAITASPTDAQGHLDPPAAGAVILRVLRDG